jgi:phosphomannomutase
VVEEIRKEVQVKLDKTSKIRSEDGLRVDEPDGWFLIRASGTEPFVRLTMEYKDKTKLDKKAEELRGIIREKLE